MKSFQRKLAVEIQCNECILSVTLTCLTTAVSIIRRNIAKKFVFVLRISIRKSTEFNIYYLIQDVHTKTINEYVYSCYSQRTKSVRASRSSGVKFGTARWPPLMSTISFASVNLHSSPVGIAWYGASNAALTFL